MATHHHVQIFRRRREGKTDYRKRRGIIVGKSPFLSVRVSGRYIYAQILKPTATGDITLCAASSRDLARFGWKGSSKNIPGAFLTGFYLGRLAAGNQVKNAIVYSGVGRFVHGSRIASVVNGAKEAGLDIAVDEKSLPDKKRVNGTHIAEYAKMLEKEDKEKFDQLFSAAISAGVNPAEYPNMFAKVKEAIQKDSKQ